MRRVLRSFVALYPRAWRDRYRAEFEALLEDISPTWRMLFDVLAGAIKMQLKTLNAWKIVAACAVAGVLVAAGYSLTVPNRYVSTAIVRLDPGTFDWELNFVTQVVLSGSSLAQMINAEGPSQLAVSRWHE
jgi:hypothetical protein